MHTKTFAGKISAIVVISTFCYFMNSRGDDIKKKILSTRSSPEILLPADSDQLAWRHDAKIGEFAGSNSSVVYELNTPKLIEWRVKQMKAQGFNTIMINGFHMHHAYLGKWQRIIEHIKMVTSYAHKNGMKVVFHHDVPVIELAGNGLPYLMEHADWLAQDIKYGKPTINYFCINNPGFRKSYFDRIEKLVRQTGIDGVQLDEVSHIGENYCGCNYCRKLFTEETGYVLPENDTSDIFFNKENTIWTAWLEWRKRSLGDWWVAMRKRLNIVNPDISIMMYSTHYGFTNHWAPNTLGFDLLSLARACDFLGTEIMTRNVYDSYRSVFAYRKAKAGLGDLYKAPIHAWLYHLNDPNYAYFGWAINHMNRQSTIMSNIHGENMSRYLNWPMRMNCRKASPMSDIAIVFSGSARDFGKTFPYINDVFGTSQSLSDAHIQHDIIMQNDLTDSLKLSKYKLLMLTCLGNMSEKEVQAVKSYVASGGILFTSGHTSLLSKNGFEQPNFQLAKVMGVDIVKKSLHRAPTTLRMNVDNKTFSIPYTAVKVKLRKGAEIIAEIINKKQKPLYPAIVSNTYGKGKCLYSAIPLGILNCQPEYKYGKKISYEKNRELYDFYISIIKNIIHDNFDFKAIDIPEKVLVNVFKQSVNNKKEILVHLLNATGAGAGLKKGDIIPGKSDWQKRGNPFPPLQKDIIFNIQTHANVTNAIVVSPDYKGKRLAVTQKMNNGYLRVIVKKEDLQAYSIVYLSDNSKQERTSH
jgi:hypothetical protein